MVQLYEAKKDHISLIVGFLQDMSVEAKDIGADKEIFKTAVTNSFDEKVHWFLFKDDNGKALGTCYCQSVHNYWRIKKRFYLGGFYIVPEYRGKGVFRALNIQLKDWVSSQGGTQLYVHIHESNEQSSGAFKAVGFEPAEYGLYVNHWTEL